MYESIRVLGKNTITSDDFVVKWQSFKYPYVTELHSHEFYELELTISGYADELVNGEHYEKKRGTVTVSTPADFHLFDQSVNEKTFPVL